MKLARPRTASLFNQPSTGKVAGLTETDGLRGACRSLPALRRKQVLVRQDESFHGLYIVRCGMLKQSHRSKNGDEQITHFFLPGDVIGLDAIEDRRYLGKVTALDTVGLVHIPFARLEEFPGAQENHLQLLGYLSRAMQRERSCMRHMMSQASDVRLARFFLIMSNSFKAQGFSPYQFRLPMTRCDIANYLCMAFETTSRLISRLQKTGILTAHGHEYCIKDYESLIDIAESVK
ncbi:helix-turn-helix domain-containing protein [Halomonas sp. McH1-25]|uniref:helix-turn-helix domain-containing protein n=1 Tax=unclassified Halomonas TaxID=2609666 RepID=UPI001EF619C9|nr:MULTISPECIES: helix-turn-helix domain-containing protein [unclassified Halomonas]MCG7600898.1 helix-turn-helix domain-containing protein [Halomonas sp. McH1-25]MCP1341486.1 helix-turn-helix domain-containing protein [Halomonas sp. FL8]MCP1360077.1 helix-turn-helix domain-containing protein [Halomonas sp. BBD45]MCP1364237.1 helix-turn-helix domain-containing protein [Halomonas sp. BBD48]